MIIVVQHAFRHGKKEVTAGTMLDAAGWPNLEPMLRQKMVRKADKDETRQFERTRKKAPVSTAKKKIKIRRA